jgi:hypothetical protein
MSISVPHLVLAAKQREIDELKRLMSRAQLVVAAGAMIHALQVERGATSIFLASAGKRFGDTRQDYIGQSEEVEQRLREQIAKELDDPSDADARIISLIAWVVYGLDAMPELRERITQLGLSGNDSIGAFSRLIAGHISLIFEVADAAVDPEISQLLVALFNLVQGKEFAGQERALGALAYASGICKLPLQERLAGLRDAQDDHFRVFLKFAEEPVAAQWQDIQATSYFQELERLRRLLSSAGARTALDPNLSDAWFDCCTDRISALWNLQCELVDELQQRCAARIADAERELMDSEGLVTALREKPPTGAGLVDHFFDPSVPVEQSVGFLSPGNEHPHRAHSVIELLQAQSRRLANVESELVSARRALDERKTIERAKGILMARFNISEEEAYTKLRTTSMQQNRRLVDVAETVLSLNDLS